MQAQRSYCSDCLQRFDTFPAMLEHYRLKHEQSKQELLMFKIRTVVSQEPVRIANMVQRLEQSGVIITAPCWVVGAEIFRISCGALRNESGKVSAPFFRN
jgi:hypothetical protein